jgi:predicted nucleic acid-binding protein
VIVIDASAVVDALTGVEGSDDLRAVMASEELSAPALIDYEVVSALRGLSLRRELAAARAEDALTDFDDLRIIRWPSADVLRRRAFQLRDTVSAYDAAYVVLAEAIGCPLLTRDARLRRGVGDLIRVEVR